MPTEGESKYVAPDRETFRALQRAESLAGYMLEPKGKARIVDHYLDTRGHALTRQGWACRLRSADKTWMLTLKGPRSVQGSVVSREEMEIPLAEATTNPSRWPTGPLHEQVERLIGGTALHEMVVIRQRRRSFTLRREGIPVIDMGFDTVRLKGQNLTARTYMVQCELMAEGHSADLELVNQALERDYGLAPEPRTKLQRALEFVETGIPPDDALLASREGQERRPASTVEEVASRFALDSARAQHVAHTAEILFEGLAPIHGLDARCLSLIRTAAMLVDLGSVTSRANRHVVARDMLLRQPIAGLAPDEQRAVAAALYLHRKGVASARIDAAFPTAPSDEWRRPALAIAALVRLAAALDGSRSQTTSIEEIVLENGRPRISVAGARAGRDARQARRRSDLWAKLFGGAPEWIVRAEPSASAEVAPAKASRFGVLPEDAIGLAAWKILSLHWGRVLAHEEGTREGANPEELHDMRVATRRLRSALTLLKSYLQAEHLPAAVQGLRETASTLGRVRDLDVSLARARAYQSGLADGESEAFAPLIDELVARRAAARAALLAHLDGPAYKALVRDFEALLAEVEQPTKRAAQDRDRVHSIAPRLLHIRWQGVRAYDPVLEGAPIGLLHALRIECKHLRYALEFFEAALPGPVAEMIKNVVAMQDHLGNLHDADVSVAMLNRFLAGRAGAEDAPIKAYRDSRRGERRRLLRAFPKAWGRFMSPSTEEAMTRILAR